MPVGQFNVSNKEFAYFNFILFTTVCTFPIFNAKFDELHFASTVFTLLLPFGVSSPDGQVLVCIT